MDDDDVFRCRLWLGVGHRAADGKHEGNSKFVSQCGHFGFSPGVGFYAARFTNGLTLKIVARLTFLVPIGPCEFRYLRLMGCSTRVLRRCSMPSEWPTRLRNGRECARRALKSLW